MSLLSAQSITKSFRTGPQELTILRGIDLELGSGDSVCIVGSSGAGKSTLLHILGTLERPTSGRVMYRGQDVFAQSDDELARFRNQKMGFVFQFHHLLSEFTALENAALPGRIGGLPWHEAQVRARRLLEQLGLGARLKHYPSELSGGEQQRVAMARALLCGPELLLADEPTGNLDSANSRLIQDLLFDLQKQMKLTLVVVTHDVNFSGRFARQLKMADGRWVLPGGSW